MEKRTLGKSGLKVSPLTFGGNVFGWTLDERKSFEILDAFVAAGFNFIDTADAYAKGKAEEVVGSVLKDFAPLYYGFMSEFHDLLFT